MGRAWIKLSTGIFDDEKIRLIEMMPEGDSILVIWLKLLCLAGKTDSDGMFWLTPTIPYNAETLATVFNRKLTTVKLALDVFQKFGMLEVIDGCLGLPNWTKYQCETDAIERAKEKHRIRQKNWREREKKKNALLETTSSKRDVTVTVRDGHVTPTEYRRKNKELEIEEEEEEKKNSSSATGKTTKGTETIRFYERNIHPISSVYERDTLLDLADEFGDEWCVEAIKESITYNKRSLKYINTVLNRWKEDGFKSDSRRNPRQHSTITKEQEMEIDQYVNF